MASFVPRLVWNLVESEGDTTNGSPVITGMADTSDIIVGMYVDNSNFIDGTTVLSKTSNSITCSTNATGTAADIFTGLSERLDFDYPCPLNTEETLKAVNQVSESVSGVRQVQTNYIAAAIDLEFRFMTPAIMAKLRDRFYTTWAAYYKEFYFYPSKEDTGTFKLYELDSPSFDLDRSVPKASDFLYKVKIKCRRVL